MKRILAVSVAEKKADFEIKKPGQLRELRRAKVRPYLRGLVQGLNRRNHQLGKDYIIHFRQRRDVTTAGTFDLPHPSDPCLVFCTSTTVVRAAASVFPPTVPAPGSPIPIVGIVSEPGPPPTGEGFDTIANICGVSAKRSQTADECFNRFFRTVPTIKQLKVLHKPGYGPSIRALSLVQAAATAKGVTATQMDASSVAQLESALDGLTERDPDKDPDPTVGVQILPVDLFLGHAQEIIDLVQGEKKLPTFFPVPDWVKPDVSSALGAYGVSQRRCGQLMAERVDAIWKANNTVPAAGRWVFAPEEAFEFVASAAAAEELNIELYPSIPRV